MQNPGKPQVDVSSTVRVQLNDVREIPPEDLIKTVGRLLDVAQDSGVNVGPNAAEVMRAYRYGQQLQNYDAGAVRLDRPGRAAREGLRKGRGRRAASRATRLAKLHQVKLGSALSIQEIVVGGDQPRRKLSRSILPALPARHDRGGRRNATGRGSFPRRWPACRCR